VNSLLQIRGVTLWRGGRLLFESLDLALGAGEALHLVGPNGSGKSSLIRVAAGLLRAQSGVVERSGGMALADDHPALDPELPLRRALGFWANLGGASQSLDRAMDALGLSALADVPVRLLSSGQTKRASLARVAASGAPLWLLDEPLNALDADAVTRLEDLVAGHLASGGAVIAASHAQMAGPWRRLEVGR
jgi:heme exporter protein A